MMGRPVLARPVSDVDDNFDRWLIIDPTSITTEGLNPMKLVSGFSLSRTEAMVNMLPLGKTVSSWDIVQSLAHGERVLLKLIGAEGIRQTIITADPKEKKLDILTSEGRSIPFNFSLDPDWKLPESGQQIQPGQSKKDAQNHRLTVSKPKNKRGKGRGI